MYPSHITVLDFSFSFLHTYLMKKCFIFLEILVGILLLVLAGVYAMTPANALPHVMPGYSPLLTKHHYTHAGAAAVLGLVCFALAWFQGGKKKKLPQEKEHAHA